MASYTILKNSFISINLPQDYIEQGWIVSGNKAFHSGCNSGYIERRFDLSTSQTWTFRYNVLSVDSGYINLDVNGVVGANRTVAGFYEETVNVTGSNVLVRFFSTGVNALEILQVYPATSSIQSDGTTLMFNEDNNKFTTYLSFIGEHYVRFINDFISFKNGRMWVHNINETRNNFYGIQYNSVITFIANINVDLMKNYHSMVIKSNKTWDVPSIIIPPRQGKLLGQRSRIKKGNFKLYQGDFFADFLRDLNDPRYVNELDSLLKGAELQGNLAIITIENNDTQEIKLQGVDIVVSLNQNTF